MRLLLEFLVIIGAKALMAINEIQMGYPTIYWGQNYSANMNTSLIETRRRLSSSPPTIADCALVCLSSTPCLTAVFNRQMGTCTLFKETFSDGGQLVSTSSNDIATIVVGKVLSLVDANDIIYAVWNTSAGQDSSPSSPGYSTGRYYTQKPLSNLFDGNLMTSVDMYGVCNISFVAPQCGQGTGIYVTPRRGPFVLDAFCIAAGGYGLRRDPLTMTIEGSNQAGSALTLGSSWTLIYNGTSGLSVNQARSTLGVKQMITNNALVFTSYRFLVGSVRSNDTNVQIAEIQLFGH